MTAATTPASDAVEAAARAYMAYHKEKCLERIRSGAVSASMSGIEYWEWPPMNEDWREEFSAVIAPTIKIEREQTIRECAEVARSMPVMREISPAHVAVTKPSDVADEILALLPTPPALSQEERT